MKRRKKLNVGNLYKNKINLKKKIILIKKKSIKKSNTVRKFVINKKKTKKISSKFKKFVLKFYNIKNKFQKENKLKRLYEKSPVMKNLIKRKKLPAEIFIKKNKKKKFEPTKTQIINNWYKLFSDLIFLNLFYKKGLFLLNFLKKKYLKNLYKLKKKNKNLFLKFNLIYSNKNLKIKLNFIKFKILFNKINKIKLNTILKEKIKNYIKKIYKYINFTYSKKTNILNYSKKTNKYFSKFGIISIYVGFHNIFFTILTIKGKLLLKLTAGLAGIKKKNIRYTGRSMKIYLKKIWLFIKYNSKLYKRIKFFKIIYSGPRKFFYKKLLLKRLQRRKKSNYLRKNMNSDLNQKPHFYLKSKVLKKKSKKKQRKISKISKILKDPSNRRFRARKSLHSKVILIGYEKLIKKAFNGCRLKRQKRK